MKQIVVIAIMLFVTLLFTASGFASDSNTVLTPDELLKIDPVLRPLVENKTEADLVQAEPDLRRVAVHPAVVQRMPDGSMVFSLIIRTENSDELVNDGLNINSVLPGFVTARLTIDQVVAAARYLSVEYIGLGKVNYPLNDVAAGETGVELLQNSYVNNTEYKGSGVLVCIIDSGIDWEHLDFRDPVDDTQSRILYIWDQTLITNDPAVPASGEQTPADRDGVNFAGLNYGVEYSQSDIEDEIDGSPAGFVREQDIVGHGTHVAGTAAGNGAAYSAKSYAGMAPEADIIVVKAGNGSFGHTNVIDGLTYAQKMSETLGKPVVANLSLGGHASAHDGTSVQELAVDNFADAGQIAVIAAGNEGMDNIHISGTVSGGSTDNFTFNIGSYTPTAEDSNDYVGIVIWYEDASDMSITIDPPSISAFTYTAGMSDWYADDTDGAVYIYNDIDGYYTNGDRENTIYIRDNVEANTPAEGTWSVTLTNNTGSPVTYHGWLYTHTMSVTVSGANSQYTVGEPGTASEAITVGAYTGRWRWSNYSGSFYSYNYGVGDVSDDIAPFSSIGPRRDDVQKPEIAAPGLGVISATSQDYTPADSRIIVTGKYHLNQGTSMACPVTAGAVALMLQADPTLTPAQIKSLITDNARTDTFTGGSLPDEYWGYGKLDALKVVSRILDSGSDQDREVLVYDTWASFSNTGISANVLQAIKFTPSISGPAAGVFVHLSAAVSITSPIYFEIWSDNGGGLPNSKLGSSVTVAAGELLQYSWNYIDLTGTGVSVSSGTDYHVVYYFTAGSGLYVSSDNSGGDSQSSYNTGGGWIADTDEYRLRPVVVTGQDALLALKVFLQGPYDTVGDTMTTALKASGKIPTTSPYTEEARTVGSIPPAITDWVLVQLRSTSDGAAVASHSAFLRNDGRVVADNGTATDVPMGVDAGDYFIVVKHRNHIAVMSDNAHTLSTSSSTLYDFTTALSQYEGSAAAPLESGVYGMFSGNADNSNNTVDANDRAETWNNRNSPGYLDSDCTLSGTVDANARAATWNNRNITTNVP